MADETNIVLEELSRFYRGLEIVDLWISLEEIDMNINESIKTNNTQYLGGFLEESVIISNAIKERSKEEKYSLIETLKGWKNRSFDHNDFEAVEAYSEQIDYFVREYF